jgi:hypothetical protein
MSEPDPTAKSSPDRSFQRAARPGPQVLGVIATVLGALLGKYAGLHMLLPIVGTLLGGLMAKKLARPAAQPMVPAFAVQAGHLLWLAVGLAIVGGLRADLLDVLLLAGGLTWLLIAPGLGPVLLLAIYQSIALIINGWLFALAEVGSTQHRALAVHILLRILALVFLFTGLGKVRAQRNQA